MKRGIILPIIVAGFCNFMALADAPAPESSDSLDVKVYFRQGISVYDADFNGNAARIDDFANRMKSLLNSDDANRISKIRISTGASPEGTAAFNRRLAAARAKAIREQIISLVPQLDSLLLLDPKGVDWQGLRALVEASDMPYRAEILTIIPPRPAIA